MVVIGDVIGDGRALGFQRGKGAQTQVPVHGPARVVLGHLGPCRFIKMVQHRTVMLDHTLDGFPRQVQACKGRIAHLQLGHDAEALHIVIKAAVVGHQQGQLVLARMGKRRVAQIVCQSDGLGQIVVEAQGMGQ